MKRILLITLICLLASFQPGFAGRSDYGPVSDCFEIIAGILTAPCQILATCFGLDSQPASRYKKSYDPCHGAPSGTPKKARTKAAEDYSTKVISPMSERPEKGTARQSGPATQPPIPEKASWPPPAADKPSKESSTTSVGAPDRTSQPPAALGRVPSQPSGPRTTSSQAAPATGPQAAAPKTQPGKTEQVTGKSKEADKTAQVKERITGDSSRKAAPGKTASPEAKPSVKKERSGGGWGYQPCAPIMMPMPYCYPQFHYR